MTAVLVIVSGLLLGVLPLIRHLRLTPANVRAYGRGASGGRKALHVRQTLMAVQVGLGVVLLTAGALLVQSFGHLLRTDPGFEASSRLTFRVAVPPSARDGEASAFHAELAERFSAIAGVVSVGITSVLPLEGQGLGNPIEVAGAETSPTSGIVVRFRRVSEDYFRASGIPVMAGRSFTSTDSAGGPGVAIIDQALARIHFANRDPLSQRIRRVGGRNPNEWLTIVGVVGNTATLDLREDEATPKLYVPVRGSARAGVPPARELAYVLQVNGRPASFLPAVRHALAGIAADAAIGRPQAMNDLVRRARADVSFVMVLLVLASGVSLTLALVGVHAVIASGVTRRTQEIGIRLALGADARAVITMLVRQCGGAIASGVAAGLVVSLFTMPWLGSVLVRVEANDPVTHGGIAASVLVLSLLAALLSARGVTRMTPLDALRQA
jgi:predicted permease